MFRKKNIEAIIQILILIITACLLIYAMLTNKVTYYVHPRFYFGIWFSIVVLIIFAVSMASNIKKARHNVNVFHYIVFVIPLSVALIFPAAGVNGKDMSMANTVTSSIEQKDTVTDKNTVDDSIPDDTIEDDTNTNDYSEDSGVDTNESSKELHYDVSEKYTQYEVGGTMIISDDIFAEWFGDVYDNLDDFVGMKCQYLAQVYSMDGLEENQFLAGRYFMVCCAADLVGYGIVCQSDNGSELNDDEWITVTGTIDKYDFDGDTVPILTDVSITKAEAPAIEYIYYNNY